MGTLQALICDQIATTVLFVPSSFSLTASLKRINKDFKWKQYSDPSAFSERAKGVSSASHLSWILVKYDTDEDNATISPPTISSTTAETKLISIPLWNLIWSERELHLFPIMHEMLINAGYKNRADLPKAFFWIYHYRPLSEELV